MMIVRIRAMKKSYVACSFEQREVKKMQKLKCNQTEMIVRISEYKYMYVFNRFQSINQYCLLFTVTHKVVLVCNIS